jgi:glycosyltransferase involved in cell wall biosynthesis
MNIAIDVSPLQTGHSIRGTGFYINHLKDALLEYYPKNIYHFFSKKEKLLKNIDIVHYPYFDPFFLTLPFWKRYKTVVTIHDLTPLVFPKDFPPGKKGIVKWQVQKANVKRMDAIITDSFSSKRDIERICKIPANAIHVVYLAAGEQYKKITKDAKETIRKKYRLPKEFALYVGDATANKNLPRLLSAMNSIEKPLVMVGKTIAEEKIDEKNIWNKSLLEARKLIKNNPLIQTLGFVPNEDLVGIYNAATVFVMPSLYEGFGLPVLEAMASGCPVITTKEGSLAEVAGEAAYYVDAYDSQAIGNAIVTVMDTPNLQKELSEKGLIQVRNFSWEKTAQKTMEIYEKVFQRQ